MSRILFVSHELSRTGAPMVLLQLARWLKRHRPGLRSDLLALKDGGMRDAFEAAFDTVQGPEPAPVKGLAALKQRLRPVDARERLLMQVAAQGHRLIYANTVLAIPAACRIKRMGGDQARVIAHVHELRVIIEQFLPSFTRFVDRVDHFIAASHLVKDELVTRWGVPADRISVAYEFSEVSVSAEPKRPLAGGMLEVGASGQVHWRKGHDLFIQVAERLRATHPEVRARFTWVGLLDPHHRAIVESDLDKAGLADAVRFVGEHQDPMPWFRDLDVFLLPSREDPFPLVCIEVGMLGKPIICFQRATGIAEVLQEGGGAVVPYLDVQAMADQLAAYWHDHALLARHGEQVAHVFARFSPEAGCPPIGAIIDEQLR